jgi:RNA polymerase sigma-70 factor (ECF subfamily)
MGSHPLVATHLDPLPIVEAIERSDLELIALVAMNDVTSLGALYDRHRSAAFGLAVRITRDRSLAEDVVHDAFLGVWRNARRYEANRGAVRTWIMAIVHHRGIDVVRKQRPVSELPTDSLATSGFVLPDIWPEVAGILDRDAIREALGTIAPAQREAIELAYFSGLTQPEIARRTGAPLGTVKSRVRLGLLALRSAMGSEAATRPTAG